MARLDMAVVIRLARHGKKRSPHYRVVACDSEFKRDGRYLEVLGTYNPKDPEGKGNIKQDRVDYWISKGAKPSKTVGQVLKRTAASS